MEYGLSSLSEIFWASNLWYVKTYNKKIVNFLDVTMDLNKGTYQPYLKPENKPFYVHSKSNHPPSITKNIPVAVNKRLNELSSNKEAFDEASPACILTRIGEKRL